MRLTLRTLLAYLDDTLEPAQAKLIGQKVAESDAAQELIARIKQVTRRRRLTTPPASGPGAKTDPNTVAEYLDNSLTAEQLAEVEEVCLASDVHLAEIAACHQILTLVLGEPALVPPTSRQRMYALVKGPEAIPFRKPPSSHDGFEGADEGHEADETLRLGLPAYRRHGGWGQRLAIVGGAAALLALLALAIWQLTARPSKSGGGGAERAANADGKKGSSQAGKDGKSRTGAAKDTTKKARGGDGGERDPAGRDDGKKDDKEPRGDRDDADRDGRKVGDRDDKDKPAEREPHKPIPDREPRVVAKYVSTSAPAPILLRRRKGEEEWKRVEGKNPAISTGDGLVSLPGYRSDLRFDNGIRLMLWGDLPEISLPELSMTIPLLESVVTLHEPEDFDLDLTLDRGRIVIANTKKDRARARVRFANPAANGGLDDWEITLEPAAEVALERWGRYRPEVPFDRNPKTREGPESELYLFVLKGQINVRIEADNQEMEAPPGLGLLIWNSKQGVEPPKDITRLPFWAGQRYPPFPKDLSKPAQEYLSNMRAAMVRSLKELSISMSGKQNVEAALVQELESDSAPKRVLVVRCFGATNDVSNLLDGLIDKQSPDVRQAAIEDLRHWIGLTPQNDLILFDTLVKKKDCSESEATAVMELLHSFSARQRSQPELYARLIDYLKQPNKRIRVLAMWHLIRLVPEGLKVKTIREFDPLGDAESDRAYDAWKLLIPDGSLPKAVKRQPPKKKG
jgi:hypothetical protein